MASIINATTTAGVTVTGDNSGSLQLATNNGTTAVTINTSQNVGIGTASPTNLLHVEKSYSGTIAKIKNNAGSTSSDAGLEIETSTTAAKTLLLKNGGTETFSVQGNGDLKFNSGYGSSAIAYGCRAWVNFDGTGTPAIRASGNVSSITDNGTGDYTINFTNALTDANYSICGTAGAGASFFAVALSPYPYSTQTSSAMRFRTFGSASTLQDEDLISIAIFR